MKYLYNSAGIEENQKKVRAQCDKWLKEIEEVQATIKSFPTWIGASSIVNQLEKCKKNVEETKRIGIL